MLGKYERVSRSEETTFPFSIGAERNILTNTSDTRSPANRIAGYRDNILTMPMRRARINLRNERQEGNTRAAGVRAMSLQIHTCMPKHVS